MRRTAAQALVRWTVTLIVVAAVAWALYLAFPWLTAPRVTVTRVVEGPVVQAFYATGTLLPEREFTVHSNVEGTLTRVLVDKGSAVAKDQPLAFVRVEEYELRHRQAKAEFDLRASLAHEQTSPVLAEFESKIKAGIEQLSIAQRERDRLEKMRLTDAASQSDLDRARDRYEVIWSLVESLRAQKRTRKLELERDTTVAQAALDIAQWNLDQQTILSPAQGVVLDRPVSPGTRVKINDPLMTVADITPERLVMRAAVDEEDKTRLTQGQRVTMTLYAYPDRVFEGLVQRVYPKADPDRRTFEVDVTVTPADPLFSAGMTGELAFIVQSKDKAAVIPTQAIQGGKVYVVRHGCLEEAPVTLGLGSIDRTEVIEGLREQDVVVISAVGGVRPGRRVRVKESDPIQASNLSRPPTGQAFRGFN